MSMLEQFFSIKYAGMGGVFEGLSIWEQEKYRELQGTYPVISLSFANVKESNCQDAKTRICQIITKLYEQKRFLLDSGLLTKKEHDFFDSVQNGMPDVTATISIPTCATICAAFMGKKSSCFWMNTTRPCRKPMSTGFGMESLPLCGTFSIPRSKQTHGWNGGL